MAEVLKPSGDLLLLTASVAACLGLSGLLSSARENSEFLWHLLRVYGRLEKLKGHLTFVRWRMSAGGFRLFQLGVVAGAIALGIWVTPFGLAVLVFGWIPKFALDRAVERRRRGIETQIEGWLSCLARALQAAPSLGEAIEVSASLSEAPLSEELKVLVGELAFGRPLEQALAAWSARVESHVLTLSLSILNVGRRTGGRLGEVLMTGAEALREMERLEGVLRTKTAEGRAQAWVIGILPLPLCVALQLSDPEYFDPLASTPMGHVMIFIAAILWVIAILAARKILAVDI